MADIVTVVDGTDGRGGLREELANHVLDISPQAFPDDLFLYHDHLESEPIESMAGARPRLFTVAEFDAGIDTDLGASTHDVDLIARIIIWYPAGVLWRLAAQSDFWQIRQALLDDQSYTTGVQGRIALDLSLDDYVDTDDGFFLRIPILCRLRIT